jgi:acetylornithine deacetylase/succinyl-diaminopimelate desuccinylase-like protein
MNESIAGRIMDEVDVDLAVALTQELVRVPSVVGDETAIGETLERALGRLGVGRVWREPVHPGRDDVLWEVPGARPGRRARLHAERVPRGA